MIIRWPEAFRPAGVQPGALDERLISFVDLAPTILSLAGVQVPAHMHGRPFATTSATTSAMTSAAPNTYIYAARDRIDELMDRQRAVRDTRFKYIRSWYPEVAGGTDLEFRNNIATVREMRALFDAGKLNTVQRQWYEPPGEERLFDLQLDPFEINDVSRDPQYQGELPRMRAALDAWLAQVGDWSEEPESAMVARFEPNGERQVTPAPTLSVRESLLVITPAASGHSLEYRIDDGDWQLYTGPVSVESENIIEARAVRYGWEESEIVIGP
jgi:arylsulfatase A-like enzyme